MGEHLDPIWIKTVVKEGEAKTSAQKAFWNTAHCAWRWPGRSEIELRGWLKKIQKLEVICYEYG